MKRILGACIIVAALTGVGAGCAGFLTQPSVQQSMPEGPSAAAAKARIAEAHGLMQARKYAEAAAAYRQFLQEHPGTEWAPEAKYGIALAAVASDNPQKDYAAGAAEFDEFLVQFPQDKRAGEAHSWRSALKSLLESRKENDRLHKTLQKLKNLDVQQEERRLGR
jgi:outer membrane protein assembly factor BamD (BamD/ComL family)